MQASVKGPLLRPRTGQGLCETSGLLRPPSSPEGPPWEAPARLRRLGAHRTWDRPGHAGQAATAQDFTAAKKILIKIMDFLI